MAMLAQTAPNRLTGAADLPRPTLTRFLNAYWLRPENALWMSLRSRALAMAALEGPIADVSCGDGVFSFMHAGGDFCDDFDVFHAVGRLNEVRDGHADMFDIRPEAYLPRIAHRPARKWACGSDLKPNLLTKAAALGFYERLEQHDNDVTPLPLDDHAFRGLYCNSAYWLTQIDAFLRELGRVTQPNGLIVLHVKLADMQRYTLEPYRAVLGDRFLSLIGRGRMECWPTVCSRTEWERRFQAARLDVVSATPFVTRTHAHIWDVGLRPIAPLLVRMTQALTPDTRTAIKQDWVGLFEELLAPMARADFELSANRDAPAEIQYVLRPRG